MSIPTAIDPLSRSVRRAASAALDLRRIRDEFPILKQKIHGHPLVYLDNAATSHKPRMVLDALARFYTTENSNVHRGVHLLSERASRDYEDARVRVQRFLNAASSSEIIFVRGATEAINLVAQSFARPRLQPGDEILITHMEHHSNIVPWQIVCQQTGAVLRAAPIDDRGQLILEEFEKLLGPRTRLVSVVHLSNSLGTINPVRKIVELAHRRKVPVLLDGAQAASHLKVDVRELDCDFYVFSGHKLYGPTGIGVLYGKEALLDEMPPYQGGGDMIASVTLEKTTYNTLPFKFEAGTPHIAGAIGLAAALDYMTEVGIDAIAAHEQKLLEHATARLEDIQGIRRIGTAARKAAVVSFVVDDPPLSALDVGTQLDLEGIAVRTGHHCCQPVMNRFGIPGTARASFAMYNTLEEVDVFADALEKIVTQAAANAKAVTQAVPVRQATLTYAPAAANSPQAAADRLIETFDFLEDWSERYQCIIDLGKKLLSVPQALKTEANRVHGCQSTVFLSLRKKPGSTDVVEFLADSDADIVSGLIFILQQVYSGQSAGEVLAFDVEGFFHRLGLDNHLTLGRRNGLAAMVQRIRDFATATMAAP